MTAMTAEIQAQLERHVDMIRQMRAHYGFPPEPAVPLTFEEMKEGEIRNAEAVTAAAIKEFGYTHAGADWHEVWRSHGATSKRDLPWFAAQTILAGCWTAEQERDLVADAWTRPEWPGQMDAGVWRALFVRAGFMCDDEECETHPGGMPHDGPITVYRGSFVSAKRGLAWTTDRSKAEWFAGRGDMTSKGRAMKVWQVKVPAEKVLAHFSCRGESEVIADVRGLRIKEVAA